MNGLKGYRNKYGVTQPQLADHLKLGLSNYSKKEKAQNWKLEDLKKILEFFRKFEADVTVEKIFF